MLVLLKSPVTCYGKELPAGEVIDLPEKSAKSLIENNLALEAEPGDEITTAVLKHAQEAGNIVTNVESGVPGANVELVAKGLNDQYTRDELAEKAKAIGVEFPYNAKKADIIAAVIEQGKADTLLK